MVSRIVGSATECFVTSELAAEIEAFFNARPAEVGAAAAPGLRPPSWLANMTWPWGGRRAAPSQELAAVDRTLKQSLERIRANERWLQRDRAAVAAWLQANIKA